MAFKGINNIEELARQMCLIRLGLSKYMIKIFDNINEIKNCNESDSPEKLSIQFPHLDSTNIFNNNICIKNNICIGHSHHYACVFKKKNNILYVISTGQNKYNPNGISIHAEDDAIRRLLINKKGLKIKTLESVNLLVIRTTRNGLLCSSIPCIHCIKKISDDPIHKGYKINKIYYSNENGNIEATSLLNLVLSNKCHISSYYRHKKFNLKKWFKWRNEKNKQKQKQ